MKLGMQDGSHIVVFISANAIYEATMKCFKLHAVQVYSRYTSDYTFVHMTQVLYRYMYMHACMHYVI